MISIMSKKTPQENYKLLAEELLMLIKAMKANPKSYTLWFHRQWSLLKGLDIE